jgi:N-acyl-D-aspartate/D-glutamate deacylase
VLAGTGAAPMAADVAVAGGSIAAITPRYQGPAHRDGTR